jgi:hypothetical protein
MVNGVLVGGHGMAWVVCVLGFVLFKSTGIVSLLNEV